MRATLHPEAIAELFEAMAFYEKAKKGLGDEYYDDMEATIRKIEAHPERWPYLIEPFRRCRADQFPYKLVYEILLTGPFIVAVMHNSRDPGYWLTRVT